MKSLARAPSGALRGDVITGQGMLPSAALVASELSYWQTQLPADELDFSHRSNLSRELVSRLVIIDGLHQASREAGAFPLYMRDGLSRLQLLGGNAVAASLFAKGQPYIERSRYTPQAHAAELGVDYGDIQMRWHARPAILGRLIADYEPSGQTHEWFHFDDYYLHLDHDPDRDSVSKKFEDSFANFYDEGFDPAQFVTITPIIKRRLLEAV